MNKMKTAMDYFNESAGKWDEKPQRVAMARAVAEEIVNQVHLSKNMTAMEFGCGTGLISSALAPMLKSVLAVDMSENMLTVFDEKIKQNNIGNIFTRLLDLSKDEFPEERFDLIYSGMALHHVKDVDALLGMFFQMLNPGGIVALADLDTEDGGFHGDIPDVFHLGFDRQTLAEKFERKGFSAVKTTTAHVMKKENVVTGQNAEFPVFLITAVKE
jgi:2-polyprenyl-3-methyl-5-hydroxy-6-metoxy-1,4-benzoquinol methylase